MAKTDVAEVKGGVIGLPMDYLKSLGEEAKDIAATERPAISKFGTRAGMLKYAGQPVAGNNLDVVILYASYRNTFYSGRFDPNNIQNPTCFALSNTDEGMAPHDNSAQKQNETCGGCWANQWKSDKDQDGNPKKGKACKESRRMVVMPASALESVNGVKSAELAILDLPVTSAKVYGAFVNTVAATAGVPPWAVKANIKLQPHGTNQFEVILTPLEVMPSKEIIEAVRARVADAKKAALEPYDETSETNSAQSMKADKKEKF